MRDTDASHAGNAPTKGDNVLRTTTKLEMRLISDLKPYENNARVHSAKQIEQLRASLREFGFVSPVLIDCDGGIIAGHGRIEAAKLEGLTEAPCVLVEHLSEAQRRAYILADNRLAELASWDMEAVESELLFLLSPQKSTRTTATLSRLLSRSQSLEIFGSLVATV